MEHEQRHKTLRELRAEALAREGYGIRCPKCGAAHLPQHNHSVGRTKALGPQQSIRRERACRNCGHVFLTKEIVIGKVISNGNLSPPPATTPQTGDAD